VNLRIKVGPKSAVAIGAVALLVVVLTYRTVIYAPDVAVAEATDGQIVRTVHGPGTVQSRFPVVVSPRITAALTELYVDQGDRVRRGQRLARLDGRDLAARLATARTGLALARSNQQRTLALFERGFAAQAAMDVTNAGLRAAQASEREAAAAMSYTEINAPFDGVITARTAELGHTSGPGDPLFRLVNPEALWAVTRIDESVVGQVSIGQTATIELRTGERHAGTVARIALESDAAARELEVDVAFDRPLTRFAIGQEAEVLILAGEERGVVIPASAVFQRSRERGVLVIVDGRARFRPVETGAADGDRVVARTGVAGGELVVRAPAGVRLGARVRAVLVGGA